MALLHVVASDRAGWSALEPALKLATAAGHNVLLFLTGACAEQVKSGILVLDQRWQLFTGTDVVPFVEAPHDVLLVASSASEQGSRIGADAIASAGTPVLLIQDMYGSAVPMLTLLKDRQALDKIMTICVIDEVSRDHLMKNGFIELANKIVITGAPHFDDIPTRQKTWEQERKKLRKVLQIKETDTAFLVVGQPEGTAETLALVEEVSFRSEKVSPRIIVTSHPSSSWLNKRLVESTLKNLPSSWVVQLPEKLIHVVEDLLPATDVVLSGSSTVSFYAVLCQMRGAVYVGTPTHRWELYNEKKLLKPPEVEMGAAWYATTPDDLMQVLPLLGPNVDSPQLKQLAEAQRLLAYYHDGRAGERVWQSIEKLVTRPG